MNENAKNKQIEDFLRKAHLPEPSPQLHEHITAAAKRAWNQTEAELPWLIPFKRLVASAAAAILIIWLANYYSECTLAQWQSEKIPATSKQSPDYETLPEMPYGPFMKRLAVLNRRSSMIDASALNNHIEALQHILNEAQQNRLPRPPAPAEGSSSLLPTQPVFNSYS